MQKKLKSVILNKIKTSLETQNKSITFFDQAWSNSKSNWVYFDAILDIELIKKQFDPDNQLLIHENLDRKSGLEKGLIDPLTKEAIIGTCE